MFDGPGRPDSDPGPSDAGPVETIRTRRVFGPNPELRQYDGSGSGFRLGSGPLTALAPISKGRVTCMLFDPIVSKMQNHLFHWSLRMLSIGGKLILLCTFFLLYRCTYYKFSNLLKQFSKNWEGLQLFYVRQIGWCQRYPLGFLG